MKLEELPIYLNSKTKVQDVKEEIFIIGNTNHSPFNSNKELTVSSFSFYFRGQPVGVIHDIEDLPDKLVSKMVLLGAKVRKGNQKTHFFTGRKDPPTHYFLLGGILPLYPLWEVCSDTSLEIEEGLANIERYSVYETCNKIRADLPRRAVVEVDRVLEEWRWTDEQIREKSRRI
jgi:hypothetical protein